jgi:hypothetical protein
MKRKQRRRQRPIAKKEDAWARLRGSMKDIFAELGGGEAYLRAERGDFSSRKASERDCGG